MVRIDCDKGIKWEEFVEQFGKHFSFGDPVKLDRALRLEFKRVTGNDPIESPKSQKVEKKKNVKTQIIDNEIKADDSTSDGEANLDHLKEE